MSVDTAPAGMYREVLGTLLLGFAGAQLPDWVAALLEDGLAGICLYGDTIGTPDECRRLVAQVRAHKRDAIVAVDEEGGDVTRLHFCTGSPYPGNALLGRLDDLAVTEQIGRDVGAEAIAAGCTLLLAPVADVSTNPLNPVIGVRSFGADPHRVSAHVGAWIRGAHSAGIAVCTKHFPGHGDTTVDSHLGLPRVTRDLDALSTGELISFRAAIAAGTDAMMTAHILLPALDPKAPATMSPRIVGQLLRQDLGFAGVVLSDALDMEGARAGRGIAGAAVRSLAAGVDLLCLGGDNDPALIDEICATASAAVRAGALTIQRIGDAARKVRALQGARPSRDLTWGQAAAAPMPSDRLAAAFEISDRARRWIDEADGRFEFITLEAPVTPAINAVPWGPAASAIPSIQVSSAHAPLPVDGGYVAVVGRDIHRHEDARAFADRAREALGQRVICVEMGMPGPDLGYADIATFGASALVGKVLVELLRGHS